MSTPRTLIIGLDGATFDLIEPWARAGYLPTLARLGAGATALAVYRQCGVYPGPATILRTTLMTLIAYALASVWRASGTGVILELSGMTAIILICLFLLRELTRQDLAFGRSLLRRERDPSFAEAEREPRLPARPEFFSRGISMKRNIIINSVVLALVVSMVDAQPALAYLDPLTGGLLFQLLAAIFAFFTAILLFFSAQIRMAFARVKRFLRNVRRKLSSEASPQTDK